MQPVIVWFRHDLRLADQPAIRTAVDSGAPVICVYILDEQSDGVRPLGGASRWWLHHSLAALRSDIEKSGGRLHFLKGAAGHLIPQIAEKTRAEKVFWTRRYYRAGIEIDKAIKQRLKDASIEAESFNGHLLFEPWEIETKSGTPYGVFTPFWKAARSRPEPARALPRVTRIGNGVWPRNAPETLRLDELKLLPTKPDWAGSLRERWEPGEAAARARLREFLDGPLKDYSAERDRPDRQSTSFLSPYLAFGEISPRTIWHAVRLAVEERKGLGGAAEKFLSEIGWREFSYHLLYYNPDLARKNYNEKFDAFPWRGPEAKTLRAWQRGRTGIPIVDAGMRELWQTGYMHNRVRMIAASFLIKNLMIDWREGEEWFWDTLCDADPANNAASWQWVAGSGADAAPYFRIFNPVLQGEKFDPNGDYVRTYVPELSDLPAKYFHKPWEASDDILHAAGIERGKTYPAPIADLRQSRERALAAFKKLSD